MKQPLSPVSGTLEQVYLLERDAGLMCRILGLYAARGVDVLRVEYAYAAQDVMTLKVGVTPLSGEGCADVLRVLVARAASLVGVLAAAEVPLAEQRSQSQQAAVAVL